MAKLLIVDNDKNIRRCLSPCFQKCGHEVEVAESGKRALELVAAADYDLVLSDERMTETNGLELLHKIKRRDPSPLVVLMTGSGTVENAVAAMKAGAFDYITKPFAPGYLEHMVKRALEFRVLQTENRILREVLQDRPLLETRDPAMLCLLENAKRAAASDATILLIGESGSGKSVLAGQIHRWSQRRERSFVTVNCNTISEHLLDSELFGHARGSFTGATKDKPGRLEAADGGTLFIDAIAELSAGLQAKLLRFLNEQAFERVGSENTLSVDVRIIATSNRDLASEVTAGRFREELFYRLNVIMLRVPPLREHAIDVLPLANRILAGIAHRIDRKELQLSPEACDALTHCGWPGNVRELRNALERASVLCRGNLIKAEHLPDLLFRESAAGGDASWTPTNLRSFALEHVRHVLEGSPTLEDAAASLGLNPSTMWRNRKRYKLDPRCRRTQDQIRNTATFWP